MLLAVPMSLVAAAPAGAIGSPTLDAYILKNPVPGWVDPSFGPTASPLANQQYLATETFYSPLHATLLISVLDAASYPFPPPADLAVLACGPGGVLVTQGTEPQVANSLLVTCHAAASPLDTTTAVVWRNGNYLVHVRVHPSGGLTMAQFQSIVVKQAAMIPATASNPPILLILGTGAIAVLLLILIALMLRRAPEPAVGEAGGEPAEGAEPWRAAPPPAGVPESVPAPAGVAAPGPGAAAPQWVPVPVGAPVAVVVAPVPAAPDWAASAVPTAPVTAPLATVPEATVAPEWEAPGASTGAAPAPPRASTPMADFVSAPAGTASAGESSGGSDDDLLADSLPAFSRNAAPVAATVQVNEGGAASPAAAAASAAASGSRGAAQERIPDLPPFKQVSSLGGPAAPEPSPEEPGPLAASPDPVAGLPGFAPAGPPPGAAAPDPVAGLATFAPAGPPPVAAAPDPVAGLATFAPSGPVGSSPGYGQPGRYSPGPAIAGLSPSMPEAGGPPSGSVPSPGWHADPTDSSVMNYWDGSQWAGRRRWTGAGWSEADVPA